MWIVSKSVGLVKEKTIYYEKMLNFQKLLLNIFFCNSSFPILKIKDKIDLAGQREGPQLLIAASFVYITVYHMLIIEALDRKREFLSKIAVNKISINTIQKYFSEH